MHVVFFLFFQPLNFYHSVIPKMKVLVSKAALLPWIQSLCKCLWRESFASKGRLSSPLSDLLWRWTIIRVILGVKTCEVFVSIKVFTES